MRKSIQKTYRRKNEKNEKAKNLAVCRKFLKKVLLKNKIPL